MTASLTIALITSLALVLAARKRINQAHMQPVRIAAKGRRRPF